MTKKILFISTNDGSDMRINKELRTISKYAESVGFNLDKIFKSRLIYKINLFLGKISYSIYLFHLIIIYIIGLNKNLSFFAYFIIFIIVQIGVSTLLYYFFEEPILNSRPKYK